MEEHDYQLAIIGGGPASFSAAIYAKRKNLSTAVIAKEFGGQLLWSNEVENYPGIQSTTGYELMKKFQDHVKEYGPDQFEGEEVTQLKRDEEGEGFLIETKGGEVFHAQAVVVASGSRWRKLGVPGEEDLTGKGVSYCTTCDGPLFADRDVLVVGGGNSAFEGIIDLLPIAGKIFNVDIAPEPIADPILKERVGEDAIEGYYNHEIVEIQGEESVSGVKIRDRESEEEKVLDVEGVFIEIGLIPNSGFAEELLELNEAGEIVVDCKAETNVPGIYGAGDVTNVPEKQIVISAGEGAKAALGAYRYLIREGQI